MCDLPGPGLEPMSPALASGFLTTAPPGKPKVIVNEWQSWDLSPLSLTPTPVLLLFTPCCYLHLSPWIIQQHHKPSLMPGGQVEWSRRVVASLPASGGCPAFSQGCANFPSLYRSGCMIGLHPPSPPNQPVPPGATQLTAAERTVRLLKKGP